MLMSEVLRRTVNVIAKVPLAPKYFFAEMNLCTCSKCNAASNRLQNLRKTPSIFCSRPSQKGNGSTDLTSEFTLHACLKSVNAL